MIVTCFFIQVYSLLSSIPLKAKQSVIERGITVFENVDSTFPPLVYVGDATAAAVVVKPAADLLWICSQPFLLSWWIERRMEKSRGGKERKRGLIRWQCRLFFVPYIYRLVASALFSVKNVLKTKYFIFCALLSHKNGPNSYQEETAVQSRGVLACF